jgi:hypothetical protein
MTRDEIGGLEFDWLAADADGRVALMSAAGTGLVPDVVLAAPPIGDALHEHFKPRVLRVEWDEFAAAGLYVYDCDPPLRGHYRRVAVPALALHVSDLPEHLRRAAQVFAFSGLSFATAREMEPFARTTDAAKSAGQRSRP